MFAKQLKMGFSVIFHRFDKEVDVLGRVMPDKATDIIPDITDLYPDMKPRETVVVEYLTKHMTLKEQAVNILQNLPDEKMSYVIDMLRWVTGILDDGVTLILFVP